MKSERSVKWFVDLPSRSCYRREKIENLKRSWESGACPFIRNGHIGVTAGPVLEDV